MFPSFANSSPVSPTEWERRLLVMHGATETGEFIKAVFDLLKGTVRCDFALANLRNLDGVPLLARDSMGREFGPDYMERFFKANPTVGYVLRRPGLRVLHTRDSLPPEEKLKRSVFYTDFMQPENWRHSVALFFWGFFPPLPQNVFCVFRSEDQPDFDEEEVERLRQLHPHIATALKRLKKQLKSNSSDDRINALLNSLPGHVTLLDWDLRVTHQSTSARRLCAEWMKRAHETPPKNAEVPAEILAACNSMKEDWRSALQSDPQAQLLLRQAVAHPEGIALSADVTLILQQDSLLAHPGFIVHFLEQQEGTSAAVKPELALLTPAERDAVLLAAEGHGNAEIAQRLGISVAAVKLRLHGAFKKLDVRNRTQLAAMLH